MFPNLFSSAYEISSKCNAFVQIEDERSEGLGDRPESLNPMNPSFEVPEMRDECKVVKGTEPSPHLTVIAKHPSPAATTAVDHFSPDSNLELISPKQTTPDTNVADEVNVGNNSAAAASLVRVKTSYKLIRCSAPARGETPFDIPTNDGDKGVNTICGYYERWGLIRGGLRGGGEGALAASGLRGGDNSWGAAGASGAGGSWAQGQPPAQGAQWSGGANRQSVASTSGNNNNSAAGGQGAAPAGGNGPSSQTPVAATPAAQPPTSQGQSQPSQSTPTSQSQSTTTSQPATSAANNANNNSANSGTGNTGTQAANSSGGNNSQAANGNAGSGWNGSSKNGGGNSGQLPATSTKQQMEQLNSMREALFSQDGWGGQNVNQDSNWDIPGSPEPGSKDAPAPQQLPMWKPNINNVVAGTDLWEANLRNGGALPAPAQQQPQKTPWTHTPANNIGGTWGEEDDMDTSNMWTGVPAQGGSGGSGAGGQQWGEGGPGWAGGKKEGWGGPGWVDQRDLRPHGDGRQMMPDPREHLRPQPQQVNIDHRGMSGNSEVLQARGITGRLNGVAGEAIWQHHGLAGGPHGKLPQWGSGAKPSGWDEPSPPTQRRPMPNYDDGTSLWSSQGGVRQPTIPTGSKVSHWKDLPAGGQSVGRTLASGRKDGPWPHAQRNGWADGDAPAGWPDEKTPWLDPSLAWQHPPNHNKPWDADIDQPQSWLHPPKQPPKQLKLLSKEAIWNSRQFRLLTDMQYKKDDVENALRMSGMNVEDALELLNRETGWPRGRGGHGELEAEAQGLGGPFGAAQGLCLPGYQGPPPTRPAPAQPPQQPSASQLRMLVQQIQMAVQAGYLNHQILSQPLAPQTLLLLNQLLNQIKVLQGLQGVVYQSQASGVKPPTLVLQTQVKITQTKQHIQNLQNQIANQQAVYIKQQQQQQLPPQQQPQQPPPQQDLFRSLPVHDPISALQSTFTDLSLKDPQMAGTNQQSRLNQWKLPLLDKESELSGASEFSRAPGPAKGGSSSPSMPLSLSGPPADATWSSRAGDTAAWPAQPSAQDPVQDDSSKDSWPNASQQQAFSDLVPEFEPGKPWKGNAQKTAEEDPSITPGQCVRSPLAVPTLGMKEHMLANNGSSGGGKSSPTSSSALDIMPIPSLGPSTWSFTPPAAPAQTGGSSALGSKLGGGTKWGESAATGELWGNGKASRPPPGLPSKPAAVTVTATPTSTNGWAAPRWSQSNPPPPQSSWNPSTWLLLRNLTPQIDGSTLKTLCLQHGPLVSFHLYLSNGIALARYTSREEAQKAQGALNNCVLGNTTIFAENPSDNDVGPLVQHLSHGSGGGGAGGAGGSSGGGAGGGGGGTWRPPAVWSSAAAPAATSLWPDSTSEHRNATPSSLNSFLPGDLLGGESM